MSAERRIGQVLVFATLLAIPLVFTPSTVEVFEYPKVAILALGAIALAALGLSAALARPRRGQVLAAISEPISAGVLLFLASAAVSALGSISVRTSLLGAHESFAGLGTIAAYAVLFFAIRTCFGTPRAARWLLLAPVLGAVGAAAYALVQVLGLDPYRYGRTSPLGTYPRPFGTLGHPVFLTSVLGLSVPLALAVAVSTGRRLGWAALAILMIAAASLCVASVVACSVVGWLALGAGLLALFLGWIAIGERRGAAAILVLPLLVAPAVLALIAALPNGEALQHALGGAIRGFPADLSLAPRRIWGIALDIFRERPLLGCGLDAFQLAFEHHRTVGYWLAEWNGTPTKAHDEVLQVLATQGIPGGLALLAIAAGLVSQGARALRRAEPEDRPLLVALLASLAGFLAQSIFSFTIAATGVLFVTAAALISAAATRRRVETVPLDELRGPTPSRELVLLGRIAIFAGALLLAWLGVVRPFVANVRLRQGATYLQMDQPEVAIRWLHESLDIDSSRELAWVRLGTAEQLAARKATDPGSRRSHLVEGRRAYERSIELVPANSYDHANLGRLLGDLRKEAPSAVSLEDVFACFDRALELDPNNAYFYADAANVALAFGDRARARSHAERCAKLYPRFGPPLAQLGYVELLGGRDDEARELLDRAVRAEWHGDESGRAIASSNLAAIERRPVLR